jgi:hypothetical protein
MSERFMWVAGPFRLEPPFILGCKVLHRNSLVSITEDEVGDFQQDSGTYIRVRLFEWMK